MAKHSVLFVCLGNICRSPLGEGIFQYLVDQRGLTDEFLIDSCGTSGYHSGSAPHEDSRRVAREHGISIENQRSRQVQATDMKKFSVVIAMDRENKSNLLSLKGADSERIFCMREFDPSPDSMDVPDPYWSGDGFENVYDIIERSSVVLLDHILSEQG